MHPTPEQTAAKTLRRQKIQILQKLGKPAEAAAYACAEAERMHADADAQWAAVSDAADASAAAGKSEKALNLLASFVRQQEQTGTMTSQSAAARLRWADEEIARDNLFEASEILRAVVKESEGKGWGVYLRTGYAKAYNAAIERLAQLRTKTSAPLRN
jgi:hypothetical protein